MTFSALKTPLALFLTCFSLSLTGVRGGEMADVVYQYCADCHDAQSKKGGVDLSPVFDAPDTARCTARHHTVGKQVGGISDYHY